MVTIHILVAVCAEAVSRYQQGLASHPQLRPRFVASIPDALAALADNTQRTDALVLDNGLDGALDAITQLRQSNSRLLIVLIDEDADFALPGQADDVTTAPFSDGDLARRIDRLMSERRLETLRADTMPPVREFAKLLRKAGGDMGKEQVALSVCRDMGYDYAAFYQLESVDPLRVTLKAQDGAQPLQANAPMMATEADIIGWVAKTGQSRIAASTDELTHPLVKDGRLGAVACTPVGSTNRYGVIVACRVQPESITQQQVLLLELVSAQLASVISKR